MPGRIEIDQLRALLDSGAQLVEVLPSEEYEEEHLPRAISIPLGSVDARSTATLDKTNPVVIYCWDYL
jgi:rhodanese-related sulfurtransferase